MNARFFRYVQDAPWYAHFLLPVLESLQALSAEATVLDVGTGAGKLIELGQARYPFRWLGVDADASMLAEARQRPALRSAELLHLQAGERLPWGDNSVDAVTFCSVLFLVPQPDPLLQEAWRVLRPGGRVVALTPSGTGNVTPAVLGKIGANPHNWTFFLWRRLTASSGRAWVRDSVLAAFAQRHAATYRQAQVFGGLATLEIIERAARDAGSVQRSAVGRARRIRFAE